MLGRPRPHICIALARIRIRKVHFNEESAHGHSAVNNKHAYIITSKQWCEILRNVVTHHAHCNSYLIYMLLIYTDISKIYIIAGDESTIMDYDLHLN